MTTHIANFGYTTGQTLAAKLFAIGSDTIAYTAATVTEATNRKSRYAASFTDVAAGSYLMVYFIGSDGVGSEYFSFLGDDAESVLPWSEREQQRVGSPCTVERSLADENPITFSWVNSTDTITGRVSVDNAAYTAVAGAIAYLRTDDGTPFYTLAFNAADRPSAEGTARYELTSGSTVRYVTLRTAVASGGGGDTDEIAAAVSAELQGREVVLIATPNVRGNLVLTQGDTYDGVTGGNPKAQWTATTDYTDGWAVTLTIRDKDDAAVYTNAGTVDSATLISVSIVVPTVTPFVGCPGVWEGKYDVQLTKSTSVKTIAIGKCFINEDQTR